MAWETLEKWLNSKKVKELDEVELPYVMDHVLRIDTKDFPRYKKLAGAAMRAIGWEYRQVRREDGSRTRSYFRPSSKTN